MSETTPAALRTALISISAVIASFGLTYALCMRYGAGPSPAVLAAALSVGLMRRPERTSPRELLIGFVNLPIIGLAAALVGLLFLKTPALGAAVFCAGVALSIWLRNFGPRAAAIGRTVALPLLTVLAVPVRVDAGSGPLRTTLLVLAAGAIAFLVTSVASQPSLRRMPSSRPTIEKPSRTQREGAMPIGTRMAIQMLAALALAFSIGMPVFPAHWAWIVLTAFIVCSGAIGSGDAIYKGVLRLGGAIAGTFAASLVSLIVFPTPAVYAMTVFAVLFFGIWLRQINYAYWAACATLVFALLQGAHGEGAAGLFALRIVGIFIGTLCAVAATSFIYPIRTEQVVRRRVADSLAALRAVVTSRPGDPEHALHRQMLEYHTAELERVAPPVRLHRALLGGKAPSAHPATLIDLTRKLLVAACKPDVDRAHLGAEMRKLGALLRGERQSETRGE